MCRGGTSASDLVEQASVARTNSRGLRLSPALAGARKGSALRRLGRGCAAASLGLLVGCSAPVTNLAPPVDAPATAAPAPPISTSDGTPSAQPTATVERPVQIVVTRDGPRRPAGCGPREAARLLLEFLGAANVGDQERLAQFFGPGFQWYTVTEGDPKNGGRHRLASTRSDALTYLAETMALGEEQRLLAVGVGPGGRGAGVGFVLRRRAADLSPAGAEHVAHGKAEMDCAQRTMDVWSMSSLPVSSQPPNDSGPCPPAAGGRPAAAVIACTRAESAP